MKQGFGLFILHNVRLQFCGNLKDLIQTTQFILHNVRLQYFDLLINRGFIIYITQCKITVVPPFSNGKMLCQFVVSVNL